MKTKLLLMLAAVAILGLAIGQARADMVEVPNGDFQSIYKPNTDQTVTATVPDGCYWSIDGMNIKGDTGPATYSDGTTGNEVDLPGWDITSYSNGNPDCMQGGGWGGPDGSGDVAFLCFGTWGGPSVIESEAPLSTPGVTGDYTLSADVYYSARPLVLELLVDGVALTPDTESSPPAPDPIGQWVEFTRTYSSVPAGEVTIVVGTRNADDNGWDGTGTRASVDNITLDFELIGATNPSPADGDTVPVGDVDLSWTNLDPNFAGQSVYVDVWFGTEPNELHPGYDMTKVVTANIGDPNRTTVTVSAPVVGTYYWQVNSYIYGPGHINEPNMIEGTLWSFNAVADLAPTVVIETPDMMTWSGEPVPLDATVTDDGVSDVTILWTADPADGVVFDDETAEDTNVTITKATDNPSTVTLTVAVSDVGNPTPNTDTMEIDVYDDACKTAIGAGATYDQTDFDENCITDLVDFGVLAAAWLDNYAAIGPVPK